ncbi:MAG: DNA ligase D [Acidobacteria bacterium]|nr:DNA ligase D [Acidobacteriota bacterium]
MATTRKIARKSSARAAAKSPTKKSAKKNAAQATPSSLIDEQLARYRSMRDFSITEEPSGSSKAKSALRGLPFVIQKHAASHLHYDFRLGWNGVLKSWAVAKGPSYFPGDRRLAVQVEDHPMEYGGFEGIIPKGQYGGGTVMIWDQGAWEPHGDVDEGLQKGSLKFGMSGTKMHGNWTLVRMNKSASGSRRWGSSDKPNWLLIKEHDKYERGKDDPCVTVEEPNSAVTGRSIEEIAEAETHVWQSNRTNGVTKPWHHGTKKKTAAEETPAPKKASNKPASASLKKKLNTLPQERLPEFIAPQLATHAATPPNEEGWLHELKLDGYRIQARKHGDKVELRTRSGLDWTHRMRDVADAVRYISAENAILDGEVVVLDESGNSIFAKLQASFEHGEKNTFTYFVFDLLHLDGGNLRGLPLRERKQLLSQIVPESGEILRMSEDIAGNGEEVFHRACELHAEGVIAKRADAKYVSGRTVSWLKLKCVREQEFVIGGFTLPTNGTYGIGSLLLGYYDDAGKLIYAGRTGTGFNQRTHRSIRDVLENLAQKTMPFAAVPAPDRRDVTWVKPTKVAQVRFATWTADGRVRQAAFLGLREDKAATEVFREAPTTAPKPRTPRHRGREFVHVNASEKVTPMKKSSSDSAAQVAPVRLTHPEKVLDENTKLTKQELANYYWAVAEHMLPHIADRPLSLVRCPEGSTQPCFFQKHVNHMLPPGIGSVTIKDKRGKAEPYITLNTAEALAGLAQMGVLEVHPWGSKNDSLERPDRIIIDLDPDAAISWKQLGDSAKQVRSMLKSIGLESFLKTTGGKGLHIVIPIAARYEWPIVKVWAKAFASAMEEAQPELYLTKMTKSARTNKIFVDYLRNERGATAVAPFSPRARAGAPVSMPLTWKELSASERPSFSISNFSEWKERLKKDPWKGIDSLKQKLPAVEEGSQAKYVA